MEHTLQNHRRETGAESLGLVLLIFSLLPYGGYDGLSAVDLSSRLFSGAVDS